MKKVLDNPPRIFDSLSVCCYEVVKCMFREALFVGYFWGYISDYYFRKLCWISKKSFLKFWKLFKYYRSTYRILSHKVKLEPLTSGLLRSKVTWKMMFWFGHIKGSISQTSSVLVFRQNWSFGARAPKGQCTHQLAISKSD